MHRDATGKTSGEVVVEQFQKTLPEENRAFVCERMSKTGEEAGILADDFPSGDAWLYIAYRTVNSKAVVITYRN